MTVIKTKCQLVVDREGLYSTTSPHGSAVTNTALCVGLIHVIKGSVLTFPGVSICPVSLSL